jgi:hypothetical protein
MPRNHIESQHGQALMKWWKMAHRIYGLRYEDLYHIPNGGKRSKVEAAIMKAEGVQPGKLDYPMDVAIGNCHGLKAELKAPGKKPTRQQMNEINMLNTRDYHAGWFDNWEDLAKFIMDYLKPLRGHFR